MTKAAELAKMGEVLTNNQIGGRRNIIINGGMQIFQRGNSHTSITTSGYRADRFRSAISNLGTWTITQDSDAPSGFSNSLKYDCTTADASPAASNNIFIQHKIEGQNVQHLKKGTSDAEKVTIQFYVKCNKTGNVQCNIRDRDNTRQISSIITINSANTWEKKIFTIVGDTTGTLDNDNESSFEIEWWLDAGSNYTSGTAPTAWEAVADTDRAAGTTIALGDSTDNYFQLTGVQMEIGEQATPFEHRSFGEELALCQRYCHRINSNGSDDIQLGAGFYMTTTTCRITITFPTTMRAECAVTALDSGLDILRDNSADTAVSITSSIDESAHGTGLNIEGAASTTVGEGIVLRMGSESANFIEFDAEL